MDITNFATVVDLFASALIIGATGWFFVVQSPVLHDTRARSWRHLDTMQYSTVLTADVPRVKCARHGVKQMKVPWAESPCVREVAA